MCNAIEAMEVTCAAIVDEGAVAISIIDTGPGISPEIADPLVSNLRTTTRKAWVWACGSADQAVGRV